MGTKQHILALVDAPDPDNWVQLVALHKLNPGAEIHVALTGRPVRFGARKEHATWDWDVRSAQMVQQVSALRMENFLAHFGITTTQVFDGGIATRTLVPHWMHFAEYYQFHDVDPLQAVRHNHLKPQEDLVRLILGLPSGSLRVSVGGPMTGLHQLIVRCPDVVSRLKDVHAMFASSRDNTSLMEFEGQKRDGIQFNVACDPQAAHAVLCGLDTPIYLMPTEVTRVKAIGFENPQKLREFLPDTAGARALCDLYGPWYEAAVKPRQAKDANELIYIHDLVAALSLNDELRSAIYKVCPVEVTSVPYLPRDAADWGKVFMKPAAAKSNVYAASALTDGGAAKYLETFKGLFS